MPGEFDMNAAVDAVGSGLGLELDEVHDDVDLGLGDPPAGDDLGGGGNAPPTSTPPVDKVPPGDGSTPPAAPTEPKPDDAPVTWRAEAKPFWTALAPEVKAEILKREADMMSGLETYKADAAMGKQFTAAIAPYKGVMDHYGIDAVKQIDGLMNAHYTLALGTPEQKVALIDKLIADYKVPARQPASDDPPFQDPQVAVLQQKIAGLESTINGFAQQSQQASMERATRELDAFMADPKNIYAKDLTKDMAELLQRGVAKDLSDAYTQAMWRNPVTRQQELTRQQTEKAAADAKAEAERVAAAKAAAAANVRSRAKDGRSTVPLGSMDDTLKETLSKIQARG